VNKPNKTHPIGHDDFSADWHLNEVQRNDILQADIAPLMVCFYYASNIFIIKEFYFLTSIFINRLL